ncbi:hypothetical protein [Aminipila sp.]|uniref:hypothetical protein n=2 Tax=Aminipila sp. TaxID=2060095 RepID=UPI00289E3F88|nr:hypothetical protein [Aminipila sp.]
MKAVYKNFTLGAIEENVRNLIKDCEIWSDLDLSYEEYKILCEKIETASNGRLDILQLQRIYPMVSVTHAVNFIIYEDYEEFWSAYSNRLGWELDIQKKKIMGKNWQLILEKTGFHQLDEEHKESTISPIICQAGIPNNELEDILTIIKHRNQKEEFCAQALAEDLTGWRSYAAGAATSSYIKLYPKRAAQLLTKINELINLQEAVEIDEEIYGARIVNKYYQWQDKEKYMGRTRPMNKKIPCPHLRYFKQRNQFSVVLPSFTVTNEYGDFLQYKIVDNDQNRYEGKVPIKNDAQGRYIDQKTISVKPAKAYVVHLSYDSDENALILDKKITGALGYGSVILDENGKQIADVFTEESLKNEKSNLSKTIFENIRYKDSFGKENKPIIYWDAKNSYSLTDFVLKKLNDSSFFQPVDIAVCKKIKTTTGEKHFIYLKNKLSSGLYKICEKAPFDVPDSLPASTCLDGINLLKYREEGYKEAVGSLNEILTAILMNYDSLKILQKIKTVVKETGEKRESYLDDRGCEVLILLICNFCEENGILEEEIQGKDNIRECAKAIQDIVYLISIHMLNAEQRGYIFQKMNYYNLSQEQSEACFNLLHLRAAYFNSDGSLPVPDKNHLADINAAAEIRLSLKRERNEEQGRKLLQLTGMEAMREMLHFRKGTDTEEEWLKCYQELMSGKMIKSDYRFLPTAKIAGIHQEFSRMIDWKAAGKFSSPEINFNEKKSEGIPFCGRLYLDVLLGWYIKYKNNSEEMAEVMKELLREIPFMDKVYHGLKPEIKNSIIFYERALKERYIEEKSMFAAFYYCGLVSVILASDIYMKLDEQTFKACDQFLQKMNRIFPELVERDLLLSDMYVMFNK